MAAENQSGLNCVRSWLLLFVCYPISIARSSVGSITGDRKTVRWVFCVHKDWFVPTRLQGFQDFFADQIRPPGFLAISSCLAIEQDRVFIPRSGIPVFGWHADLLPLLKNIRFFVSKDWSVLTKPLDIEWKTSVLLGFDFQRTWNDDFVNFAVGDCFDLGG